MRSCVLSAGAAGRSPFVQCGAFGAPTYVVRMVPAARWLVVGAARARRSPRRPTAAAAAAASDTDDRRRRARPTQVAAVDGHRLVRRGARRRVRSTSRSDGSTFGGIARLLGEQQRPAGLVARREALAGRPDRAPPARPTCCATAGSSVRWSYEDGTARAVAAYSPIRLPDDNDIVPAALAARLLDGARARRAVADSRPPGRRPERGRAAPGARRPGVDDRARRRLGRRVVRAAAARRRVRRRTTPRTRPSPARSPRLDLESPRPTARSASSSRRASTSDRGTDARRRGRGQRVRAVPAADAGDRAGAPRRRCGARAPSASTAADRPRCSSYRCATPPPQRAARAARAQPERARDRATAWPSRSVRCRCCWWRVSRRTPTRGCTTAATSCSPAPSPRRRCGRPRSSSSARRCVQDAR